jgi:hemolysin activation/secretion protein
VVGSTVFSSKVLAQLFTSFINKPISFAALYQAAQQVTNLYKIRGYFTSGAYIPPQRLQDGVVKIQVVEGRLEKIQIVGTRRLNPNYVRSRLQLAASKPLNQNRLLKALRLLQLNPLIKTDVSAELSAGTRPGTNVLVVHVTEATTFSTQLTLDNNYPTSVGTFARGLQINQANLLGIGDGLSAGYFNTDGSNNVNAGYTLPINPHNGTVSLNYAVSWSHIIEPPFNRLHINANYRYYDATLRQPVIQTPAQELALGLIASHRESDFTLLGSHFLGQEISPGSDNQGRTRISAIRFFQEWSKRNSREVLAARSQFSLGVGALNATIHTTAPDGRFFTWQGQGQWLRIIAPDTLFVLRGAIQVASRPLVPLEQFGLGGIDTVRGYRQDFLLTDSGASASAEFRVPVLRISQDNIIQLTPFAELGYVWNASSRIRVGPNNTLASVGIGLRWQIGNDFSARFDWGHPLVDVDSRNRTLQSQGLYFSVNYHLF